MRVFTDASFSRSPNMGGFGVVIETSYGKVIHTGNYCNKCDNNNTAEIIAIALAIRYINDSGILKESKGETIHLYTDSQNALWKIYKRSKPANDLEEQAIEFIRNFRNKSHNCIQFHLVKGHCSNESIFSHYNCEADLLAKNYRLKGLQLLYKRKHKPRPRNNDRTHE